MDFNIIAIAFGSWLIGFMMGMLLLIAAAAVPD